MAESVANQGSFSERHGFVRLPDTLFRDELPARLREPIVRILQKHVTAELLWERIERIINPYGLVEWPGGSPSMIYKVQDDPYFENAKRVLMNCDWFRIYDVIEDIFVQLILSEALLASRSQERPRAPRFENAINDYFRYAGIAWQMVKGKIIARGDDAFEGTVHTAETELAAGGRTMAAERIAKAISALSARPKPDLSGAVSHATGAMECVLDDITGEHMTLGDFLRRHPDLFPGSTRKALEGLWGFSSSEGATARPRRRRAIARRCGIHRRDCRCSHDIPEPKAPTSMTTDLGSLRRSPI
jgi:hypothetical protein